MSPAAMSQHECTAGPCNPPMPLHQNGQGSPLSHQHTPIFMQPLLPPEQIAYPTASAPPAHLPTSAPLDFYAQSHTFQVHPSAAQLQQLRDQGHSPSGSGDSDDRNTLEFPSLEAFLRWRAELEAREMVEFIKEDTYASKATPPSFHEHTKLVCARHCKSVRNKYVKLYPERKRNFPSRKIEGEGCPASISYRTYNETSVVRAMYFSQHSHPIGRENLPFTRRGRKLAEQDRKLQQQLDFSRITPEQAGAGLSAMQEAAGSKSREVRSLDASQNEPPPMARLEPPIIASEFAADAQPSQTSDPRFIQERSYPPLQMMRVPLPPQEGVSGRPCIAYEQSCANNPPMPPETSFESPPYLGHNSHPYTHQSQLPLRYQDTQFHQPQASYVIPQAEVHDHQAQYLPTPTTPSSQVQSFSPSQRYPHPSANSGPILQHSHDHRLQNTHAHASSHAPPLSPVTPQTQTHSGSPVDSRPSVAQYSPQAEFAFNQDRWNRLETLFQAVRLRARSYVLPEPMISALESLLLQLYAEGPQDTRSEISQLYEGQTSW